MEKREKLTFDEWCLDLIGEMGNSKEDLKIKEELKNLVHDEQGENVPRGTIIKIAKNIVDLAQERSNTKGGVPNRKHKCLSNIVPDVIKGTCINIGTLGVGETYLIETIIDKNKISYAEYVKSLIDSMNNVNKDGECAGDKVVEDIDPETCARTPISRKLVPNKLVERRCVDIKYAKIPTYVCIKTYTSLSTIEKGEKSFSIQEKPDVIFFKTTYGERMAFNLSHIKGYLQDYFVPEAEVKTGVTGNQGIHSVIGKHGTSGSTGPKEDNIEKDTIVEGFELEMMFDALNSVVFNKKDQISDKNINKIIKTLFKKFDITLKD